MNRVEIIQRVLDERARQIDLPGREYDVSNTPNDWAAIISRYVSEEVRRGQTKPSRKNYEDSLIKAAAIILAALEHCPLMEIKEHFDTTH
jgi:hypothetical protein